jgi:uncharacterized membrane protein
MQALAKNDAQARLIRSLGWFSIGLGLAEVAAPRTLSRFLGIEDRPTLVRALGVREIASGLGILTSHGRAEWLWSRVAGDAIDLSLLAAALPRAPGRVAGAMVAVAGVTALDVVASRSASGNGAGDGAVTVNRTLIVNRTPEELYRFWRHFENLPRFMRSVESVRALDGRRSHWVAKGPLGMPIEWDSEVIGDSPNSSIAWRSLPGSDLEMSGTVRFTRTRGGKGALVELEMRYVPPAGKLGSAVATLLGREPGRAIGEDLRRFKQLMEAGEIPTTEGQPAGPSLTRSVISRVAR